MSRNEGLIEIFTWRDSATPDNAESSSDNGTRDPIPERMAVPSATSSYGLTPYEMPP